LHVSTEELGVQTHKWWICYSCWFFKVECEVSNHMASNLQPHKFLSSQLGSKKPVLPILSRIGSQCTSWSETHVFLRWAIIYIRWACKQPKYQMLVFWKSSYSLSHSLAFLVKDAVCMQNHMACVSWRINFDHSASFWHHSPESKGRYMVSLCRGVLLFLQHIVTSMHCDLWNIQIWILPVITCRDTKGQTVYNPHCNITRLFEERLLTFQDELYWTNNIFRKHEVCLKARGFQFDTLLSWTVEETDLKCLAHAGFLCNNTSIAVWCSQARIPIFWSIHITK
jgi:hypothetical protein